MAKNLVLNLLIGGKVDGTLTSAANEAAQTVQDAANAAEKVEVQNGRTTLTNQKRNETAAKKTAAQQAYNTQKDEINTRPGLTAAERRNALLSANLELQTNLNNLDAEGQKTQVEIDAGMYDSLIEKGKAAGLTTEEATKAAGELPTSAAKSLSQWGTGVTNLGYDMQSTGAAVQQGFGGFVDLAKGGYAATVAQESAWAKVNKVYGKSDKELAAMGATQEQYAQTMGDLRGELEAYSTVTPTNYADVMNIGALAGQMGVATDSLGGYTQAVDALQYSTDMGVEGAATSMARFMNINQSAPETVDNLAAALVGLGNTTAASESEIMAMAMRMSAAGKLGGLADHQILGLSAGFTAMGMNAEAGGSAASKLIKQFQTMSETAPQAQETIDATGMSLRELQELKAFDTDGFKGLAADMGLLPQELANAMNTAAQAVNFAELMGFEGENPIAELAAAWQADGAGTLLQFFESLGAQGQAGADTFTQTIVTSLAGTGEEAMAAVEGAMSAADLSFEELLALDETDPELFNEIIEQAGMVPDEIRAAMETSEQALNIAELLGLEGEDGGLAELKERASTDAEQLVADINAKLAELGTEGSTTWLEENGLTEIRLSSLIASAAGNPELIASALGTAYQAYSDGTAHIAEFMGMVNTPEGQDAIMMNNLTLAQSEIGKAVETVWRPLSGAITDLAKAFNDMPDDVQGILGGLGLGLAGLGAAGMALQTVGAGFEVVGKLAAWIGNLATAKGGDEIGKVKEAIDGLSSTDTSKLSTLGTNVKNFFTGLPMMGKAALIAAGIGLVVTAIGALVQACQQDSSGLSQIKEELANLQISIDPAMLSTVNQQIEDTYNKLIALKDMNAPEMQRGKKTSAVVKAGYGDIEMYGEAAAYEKAALETKTNDTVSSYQDKIAELQTQLLTAVESGNTELASSLQTQITTARTEMDAAVAALQQEYTQAMSELITGLAGEDLAGVLSGLGEKYDLTAPIMAAMSKQGGEEALSGEELRALIPDDMFNSLPMEIQQSFNDALASGQLANIEFEWGKIIDTLGLTGEGIKAEIAAALESAGANEALMTAFGTMLSDTEGMANMDTSSLTGALGGLFKTLDWSQAFATGGDNFAAAGECISTGLAQGITDNSDGAKTAVSTLGTELINTFKGIMGIASPATTMIDQGAQIPAGVAVGIIQGSLAVTTAIAAMGTVINTAAASMAQTVQATLGTNWATAWAQLAAAPASAKLAVSAAMIGVLSTVMMGGSSITGYITGSLVPSWSSAWAQLAAAPASAKLAVSAAMIGVLSTVMIGGSSITGYMTGSFAPAWASAWSSIISTVNDSATALSGAIGRVKSSLQSLGSVKMPNVKLPGYASGGTVTSPTLAWVGEGEYAETIIPHNDSPRSRALLMEAASGMGLDSIDAGGRSVNITFAPQITITGNADGAEIKRALAASFAEFKSNMEQYINERAALSF